MASSCSFTVVGKVTELFPDLIECGLGLLQSFQPEVIDVAQAKQEFGYRLSFYGGISTQRTLPYGTVQEVRDETKRLIDIVGKDGGLIASQPMRFLATRSQRTSWLCLMFSTTNSTE